MSYIEEIERAPKIKEWDGAADPSWCNAVELWIDFHQPYRHCIAKYDCAFALNCDGPEDCAAYLPEDEDE
jgi:hypothetical protein